MKFNLTDLNPASTFPLDYDDEKAGTIDLRVANAQTLRDLRKKFFKTRTEYHKGQRHEVETIDNDGYDIALWDYCIAGWDGINDEKGKPIPATPENKLALMNGSPLFSQIVRDRLEQLASDQKERAKEAEKN